MTALPKLADLPPSKAQAAWMQWLKDVYPMDARLIPEASEVGKAVAQYEFKSGEESSRQNLAEKLAKLEASYAQEAQ